MTITVKESGFDKKLQIALKGLNGKVGKVGWFKKAKYPNGEIVAQVAAIQEYGYILKAIPSRPFFRPTIREQQSNWKNLAYKSSIAVLKGNYTAENAMKLLIHKASEDVKETISKIFEPPLSPVTIKRRLQKYKNKKFVGNLYKPLIDTGYMFATLSYSVEKST